MSSHATRERELYGWPAGHPQPPLQTTPKGAPPLLGGGKWWGCPLGFFFFFFFLVFRFVFYIFIYKTLKIYYFKVMWQKG
jgi:hypothetical protein